MVRSGTSSANLFLLFIYEALRIAILAALDGQFVLVLSRVGNSQNDFSFGEFCLANRAKPFLSGGRGQAVRAALDPGLKFHVSDFGLVGSDALTLHQWMLANWTKPTRLLFGFGFSLAITDRKEHPDKKGDQAQPNAK